MNYLSIICYSFILILSLFLYKYHKQTLINLCEREKCPYCFGTNFCNEFEQNKLILKETSIFDVLMNYFSVKNVFYALYNNSSVVLKKLGHNFELDELDRQICVNNNLSNNCDFSNFNDRQDYQTKIMNFLSISNLTEVKHFKICSLATIKKFINIIYKDFVKQAITTSENTFFKNIWTILQLNVEPLLLQMLTANEKWPVPHYFGACGRIIVESNCGVSLNGFSSAEWKNRAYLALQILEAAINFTENHSDFRFYLTDISPDNIAVSRDLKVTFIDLENVIMTSKKDSGLNLHYSSNIDALSDFAFSENEICESSISDHNYYAVCKLLLSKNAPWPMMSGGLLHSPPASIIKSYPQLFELIEICSYQTRKAENINCYQVVKVVTAILHKILSE